MELTRLNELLVYEPLTGEVFTRSPFRKLLPDSEDFITIWDRETKKRTKFRVSRLCWTLGNNKKLRRNQKILHKNLDTQDNRLTNLRVIQPSIYNKIQEAAKNLRGGLKILPHHKDQFDYCVWFFDNKLYRKEQYCDIIAAQQRLLVLQLKSAKILTKYCIFE